MSTQRTPLLYPDVGPGIDGGWMAFVRNEHCALVWRDSGYHSAERAWELAVDAVPQVWARRRERAKRVLLEYVQSLTDEASAGLFGDLDARCRAVRLGLVMSELAALPDDEVRVMLGDIPRSDEATFQLPTLDAIRARRERLATAKSPTFFMVA